MGGTSANPGSLVVLILPCSPTTGSAPSGGWGERRRRFCQESPQPLEISHHSLSQDPLQSTSPVPLHPATQDGGGQRGRVAYPLSRLQQWHSQDSHTGLPDSKSRALSTGPEDAMSHLPSILQRTIGLHRDAEHERTCCSELSSTPP